MEKVYIFGHRNPDTDSVTAAITLSYLKNKLGMNTIPAVLSSINLESKFALNYFDVPEPIFLNDVNIKVKDIEINERTIKILGKGSKERIVVFGVNTQKDLKRYLDDGRYKLDTNGSEYLFLNKDGNKLSSRYVRKILDETIVKASIEMHVSPHMLRHTFATEMLNNGADLVSVKDLLGHESLNTTSIYTHVSDDKIRQIYDMAHPRAHHK